MCFDIQTDIIWGGMKIAVLIVNYRSDQDTLSLLNQLAECQIPKEVSLKTFVVDNDNSDNLKQSLKKYKNISYVESSGNVGFAAGNNIGLKKIIEQNFDVIVMMNNDTLVPTDFIVNISNSKITDPVIGAIGGLIYFAKGFEYEKGYSQPEKGKVIWYGGGKIDWNNVYVGHELVNKVDDGRLKEKETSFITGCLLVTKPGVLKKVGLFDERYCLYLEDADLCERIKNTGYKLLFDPNIKLWHKVAQGSGIGSSLNDYFLTRNRLLFGFTYTNFRTKLALLRESLKKLLNGTSAQKMAIRDFLFSNYGWGSWKK